MTNREPFGIDEWYHCYNRGVDRRKVFLSKADYERFLILMHTCNTSDSAHTFNLKDKRLQAILTEDRESKKLVGIGAYSLMPNHFHFVLKEIREGGIALFMQKLFTGYTMYFNRKNERTGALFAGTFKSKHVGNDEYLKHLVSYIHLNSVELLEADWKRGKGNLLSIEKRLVDFPYSSLPEFLGQNRPERKLIDDAIFELFDKLPTARQMLQDAQDYYREISEVKPR